MKQSFVYTMDLEKKPSMKSCIAIFLISLAVLGCKPGVETVYVGFVETNQPPVNPPVGIYAATPIVGLFIGVSNYIDNTIPLTPAHTLSAALMHETFFEALRTYQKIELGGIEIKGTELDTNEKPIKSLFSKKLDFLVYLGNDKKLHVISKDLLQTLPTQDDPIIDFELPLHKNWIVMASSNGTVRAGELGQEETVRLGRQESRITCLAVSDDGGLLATGAEDGNIRIWHMRESTRDAEGITSSSITSPNINDPVILKEHTEAVTSIDVSQDGKYLVSASRDRTVCIWSPLLEAGEQNATRVWNYNESVTKVQFNSINSHVLIASGTKAQIRRLDGEGEPIVFATDETVKDAFFSPYEMWVVTISGNLNNAVLWSLDGSSNMRKLGAAKDIIFDTNRYRLAIIRPNGRAEILSMSQASEPFIIWDERKVSSSFPLTLENEDGISAVSTLSFFQDVIGTFVETYGGSLQIRYWIGEHTTSLDSIKLRWPKPVKLHFLADLRMDPNDPYTRILTYPIECMRGTQTRLHKKNKSSPFPDELYNMSNSKRNGRSFTSAQKASHAIPVFGEGRYLTRAEIEHAMAEALKDAKRMQEQEGEVLLVVYLSTHGELGTDGQPYIQLADSSAKDESSWMSYEDFIDPLRDFVTAVDTNSTGRKALAIIDTCQASRDENRDLSASLSISTPPGLIVVQAATLGQYAFHSLDEYGFTDSGTDHQWKSWGLFSSERSNDIKQTKYFRYKMSALSRAHQRFMYGWKKEHKDSASTPVRTILLLRIFDWLKIIKEGIDPLLDEINKHNETRYKQDLTISHSPGETNIDLLIYDERAR